MADPDLQITGKGGGGGDGHPDPEIREAPVSKKICSVWSKSKGGWAPRGPPLDPPLMLACLTAYLWEERYVTTQSRAVLQINNSQSETQSHFEIKPRQVAK